MLMLLLAVSGKGRFLLGEPAGTFADFAGGNLWK